jgi:hypothetical protein
MFMHLQCHGQFQEHLFWLPRLHFGPIISIQKETQYQI